MIQDINILYHGTGSTFENPDLDNSREDVDFGVGFYTTQNKETAKKWASSKRKSTINTYSFNRIGDLKIYTFKLDEEANAIEGAVTKVLDCGSRTADIVTEGIQSMGTAEMGELIRNTLK